MNTHIRARWSQLRGTLKRLTAGRRRGGLAAFIVLAITSLSALALVWAHGRSANRLALVAQVAVSPTHTATTRPSVTMTVMPSATATARPSITSTRTATSTITVSPTATSTSSVTPTRTATIDEVASKGSTPTVLDSATPTVQDSATPDDTHTPTATATVDPVYLAEDTLDGTGPGPPGPLSGLPTRPELANRRPVAVVLDNYAPDARPQTGLNRASLVFETLAEGGITRLMAIYLERDAPTIGPVRSARIYFNAWASGLHAVYAHAGGNSDALFQLLKLPNVVNLDDLDLQPAYGPVGVPFVRSWYRSAPHNLYTNSADLRAYAQQAKNPVSGAFPAALPHHVADSPWHRALTASIDVGFSSYDYNVHWAYDRASNRYLRTVGGLPQADPLSRRVEAPSNVVVLFTPVTPDHDVFTPAGVNVHTTGTGPALYFRDGHVVKGFWHNKSIGAPLELLDASGKPEAFNPGQTWIEVLAPGSPVSYQAG